MRKNYQKRYIILGIIIVLVGILIWRVSTSFAFMDSGYEGTNIVTGDKWGVNITNVSEVEIEGSAILTKEVSTIATTLNFSASLFKPGDKISFNITTENTSNLNAELYALTLVGLSPIDAEVIDYTIRPIDSSIIHEDKKDGSIIKPGEKQVFNITLEYDSTKREEDNKEYSLNLGSTVIYKQK